MKLSKVFIGLLLPVLLCPTEISTYKYTLRKKIKRVRETTEYKERQPVEEPKLPEVVELAEEEFYLDTQSCARRFRSCTSTDSFPSPSSKFSSSACLRCGICLAIALRANYTFNMASENLDEKKFDATYVSQLLDSLCNYGFQNYELRKYDDSMMVMEALLLTEHVPTAMDGEWTRQLRSTCRSYIKEYGAMKLYNAWLYGSQFPAKDMVNTLCRNGGIFRDCNNIKDKEVIIPEYRKRWYMHCTVSARVPCV